MTSYSEYLEKTVEIFFLDGDKMTGKVTDVIDADETDNGLPYMTIIPRDGDLKGKFIGIDSSEIKSVEVIN